MLRMLTDSGSLVKICGLTRTQNFQDPHISALDAQEFIHTQAYQLAKNHDINLTGFSCYTGLSTNFGNLCAIQTSGLTGDTLGTCVVYSSRKSNEKMAETKSCIL